MAQGEWSVPGLWHRKKGDYLETVRTKYGAFGLVHSEGDLEMIDTMVADGQRLTIAPYDDANAAGTEAYFLLQGKLVSDTVQTPLVAGVGDTIIVSRLSEVVSFVAQGEVRLLSITARPTFHQISTEMGDLMRMAVAVEEKDGYTAEHCLRLQKYSVAMGRVLGLNHSRLYRLEVGSYLHDLGKVRVPPEILGKPGPLTREEWIVMQQHPKWGRELLEGTFLEMAGTILEQHHERLDGSGYPLGLKGEQILLESSIVAVADTFDAITTDRPYRPGATADVALKELWRFAPTQYPVAVVEALQTVLNNEGQIP